MPSSKPWFLAGLFLFCMCGLMLQVIGTRLLSVIAFYHLAFLAISMAMLGMTAGALFMHFRSALFPPDRLMENLTWIASAFAISVALSGLLLISTVVITTPAAPVMTVIAWLKLILILLPPYVLAGMAISLALTRSPWPVGLVYGVDLLGAATGCLLVLALLTWIDAVSALMAVAAIGAAAAACFAAARRADHDSRAFHLPVARHPAFRNPVLLVALFAAIAAGNAAIHPHGLVLTSVHNRLETSAPAAVRWNSFSRIRAERPADEPPMMWGPSPHMPEQQISQINMNIDGDAGTPLYRFGGNLAEMDFLRYDVTTLAYAIRRQGRAAVIGVGGGRDLLSAYLFGFRDVTGVELNPIFVDLLRDRFREYNRLAEMPGLRLFVDEARSWFARTTERFDLIQMSLIDTWAATGAGAMSLSENGLYTVQGWQHFLNALAPDGVFTVSRWYDPENVTETGRLISLVMSALRQRGIQRPEEHVFLAGASNLATLIVSNAPFPAAELNALASHVEELGFSILLSPDQRGTAPVLRRIAAASTPEDYRALARDFHLDMSPPTDDRPFFFNQLILTDPDSIRLAQRAVGGVVKGNLLATATVAIIVVLSAILVLCTMIVPALPTVREVPGRLAWFGTVYFALIGLGFMFIEIGLIQRISVFLGHPVYGLAIGLFGIILSTGLGSLASERLPLDNGGRLVTWACALAAYVALMSLWFPALVLAFEGQDTLVRAAIALLAIMPPGFLMGFGFPAGMRLVNAIDRRPTPWFWAVNGAAGVLAASVAVGISITHSINASLWAGAACYLLLAPIGLALERAGATARSGAMRLGQAR